MSFDAVVLLLIASCPEIISVAFPFMGKWATRFAAGKAGNHVQKATASDNVFLTILCDTFCRLQVKTLIWKNTPEFFVFLSINKSNALINSVKQLVKR